MPRLLLQVSAVAITTWLGASTAQGAVGRTPGAFNVSNSGSASYSIPIAVPPGPRGIQPNLAIVYSSNASSGAMGIGWNISGLSAITRCNRTYAQDAGVPAAVTLTYSDAFCLDGQRLRITSAGGLASYGQDGTTYQTEIANFSNVTAHGVSGNGPTYFTVQARNGLTYEYGNGSNSQVLATGTSTASAWLLNKVTDRANNRMVITYLAPSASLTGTSLPSTISWTASSAGASTFNYTLTFNYSTVAEVLYAGYVANTAVVNQNLLSNITITNSGGSTIKKYAFGYGASQANGRTRLTEVKECADSAQQDCLLPTAISYQNGQAGVSSTPVTAAATAGAVSARYDFNSDGFDDLLFMNGGTGSTWYVAFGSASGYGSPVSTGIVDTNLFSVGDIFGTGRDAILANSGGTLYAYYWNDATSSFVSSSTGVAASGGQYSTHLIDVDGDGLPDLVTHYVALSGSTYNFHVTARLNTSTNGSLSFSSSVSDVIQHSCLNCSFEVYGPFRNAGPLKEWDFDGDGRGDFLFWRAQIVGSTINYVLYKLEGNGTNFTKVQEAGPTTASVPIPLVLNWNNDSCSDIVWEAFRASACGGATMTGLGVAGTRATVMDWDGDGRMDILVANGTTLGVYLSTGTGLSSLQPTSVPYSSSCVYSAADIDGDGQEDLLCWSQGGSNPVSYYLHNGAGQPPDLVNSITDGYGINSSPSYVSTARGSYSRGSAPSYPEQYVTKPFYVVNQLTASDGVGGTYTQTFSYTGARADVRGYGFEGFQSLSISDSRANSLVKTSSFQTAFPYTGMLATEDVFQSNGTTLVSHTSFTNTKTDLSTDTGNQRAFVFTQSETVQRYEVGGPKNGLQISTAATSNTFDNYGNATHVVTTLTDNDSTSPYVSQQWTTTSDVTITPDAGSNWCLTQPTQVIVTNSAPGVPAIARTTTFTPDYANCRPTQMITEPSSGTYAVTRVPGYDSFGNVNALTTTGVGMPARLTSAYWGTTGQFPMTVTNALSQQSQFGYDFNLGLRTSETDPNGISISWQYDTFGRKTRENHADGTFSTWSYDDCASAGGCLLGSHSLALLETEYNANSTFLTDSRTYFDQLDRPLVSMSRQFGGVYDRNEVRYDNFGRLVNAYMPCTWSALTTPCPYSATSTFDALGRETQVSRPVSASDSTIQTTTVVYAGRTSVTTDPNGKTSTQIMTVAGTLGRVQDHDGYGQNFTNDAFGSVLGVADSAGNTLFTASYDYGIDAFQRDATDTDLDLSTAAGQHRHYNYNALGELTSWSDAKGQSFSQTYDALSRPLVRTEPDLTTTWTWGSSASSHNIGQLESVSAGSYAEAYSFDGVGRVVSRTITIPSDGSYTYDYSYSATTGLLDTLTYPTSTSSYRLKLQYAYQNGLLQSISDFNASSTVFWTANALNPRGQVTQESLGNGVVTNRAFDALTGWLSSTQSGVGGGAALQNESYLFDRAGNLTQRQNNNVLLTESFYYDNLYRLEHSTLGGSTNLALTYFANGNIKSRTDVASSATWTYGSSKQHAVTQAGSAAYTYSYDANGNAISRAGLSIGWTSFNHPSSINGLNQYDGSSESVQFSYDHNHERWRAVYAGSTGVETTYMIGGLLEKVISAGTTDYRHYIFAGGAKIAIYSRTVAGVNTLRYMGEDHLGSVAAILNGDGTSYVKESFTAFGNRRSTCTWSGNPTAGNLDRINTATRHGYTWHTALGAMGLNDMNGRIQDAITGRFLSPDPYVTDPMFTQGYNRYSYVNNNPLSYIDPTGFQEAPANLKPWDSPLTGSRLGYTGAMVYSGSYGAFMSWAGTFGHLGGTTVGGGGVRHPPLTTRPQVSTQPKTGSQAPPVSVPPVEPVQPLPQGQPYPDPDQPLIGSLYGIDDLEGVLISGVLSAVGCESQDCQIVAAVVMGGVSATAARAAANRELKVVPRLGPKGVDPLHHNANVTIRDAEGRIIHHERVVSGNMTPAEKALGFPLGTLASHTEARAVSRFKLKAGQSMVITGESPPCPSCKGAMNRAANQSHATITYQWRENGSTRLWTAFPDAP